MEAFVYILTHPDTLSRSANLFKQYKPWRIVMMRRGRSCDKVD